MVTAGYLVELVFGGLGLVPGRSSARVGVTTPAWDYTTWLNIAALLLVILLLTRFVRTGGLPMLKMMNGEADGHHDHREPGSDHDHGQPGGHHDHGAACHPDGTPAR
jgi:hypothetical protein